MDPKKVLRIGWWEVTKNATGIDKRTAVVVVVALLALGALTPVITSQGVTVDEGLYRVGVEEDSQYYEVVVSDPTFNVRPPDPDGVNQSTLDMSIVGDRRVIVENSEKGKAARAELRSSVQEYNDYLMDQEENQTAAFPVSVTLQYEDRTIPEATGGDGTDTGDDGADGTDGRGGEDGTDGTDGTDGGENVLGDGESDTGTDDQSEDGSALGGLGGFSGIFGQGTSSGHPSDISPPFPFESLLLAFLFVLPLNFVIQAYGSTILSERLKRRGELMLVAPVTRGDIIAGKTLPYFLSAMIFEIGLTGALVLAGSGSTGGLVSVLAVTPLVLLFLSATFLAAMFARSFKELTFLTVTITVGLTSYAFVPAIFTDITPISLISPLTVVVMDLQGMSIAPIEFAFSTIPPMLTAIVMFGLGAGLYREEDMFSQRPIPAKVLDMFAGRIKRRSSALKLSAILIPFVLVTELIGVAILFAIPTEVSIPAILLVVAVIEEVAKSVHIYAGYVHRSYSRTLKNAVVLGALSGLGFFLAEKLVLMVQLLPTDIPDVEQAAFITGSADLTLSPLLVVALLAAPLVLHAVTAMASSIGAARSRRGYVLGILVAIGIHLAYNLAVVSFLG